MTDILTLFSCAALLALTACGDRADRDGDGEVSADERAAQIPENIAMPLRPGLWESKVVFTNIKVSGLRDSKKQNLLRKMSKAASKTSCLSAKQARRPPADFFGGGVKDACKYRKFEAEDDQVMIALSCTMDGMAIADMELSGQAAAEKLTLNVEMDLRLPMIGTVSMKGTSNGRYLGECPG